MPFFLGVDIGSVSTKFVIIDEKKNVVYKRYTRTLGQPIQVLLDGLGNICDKMGPDFKISSVGATGSGRNLVDIAIGADIVKNEITTHGIAISDKYPNAQTIFEIGGQDSKVIIMRNQIVVDFAMNTVCAAGTGSFLDQQALRLNIDIDKFGGYALKAEKPVRIAGRCTVFAESDMIHKQQMGHTKESIIAGLCKSLVLNYLNNVCRGKELLAPMVFIGGVAANSAIRKYLADELGRDIIIPENFNVMGALGSALLAQQSYAVSGTTRFKGFDVLKHEFTMSSFECNDCSNNCEIVELKIDGARSAVWGDRCQKFQQTKVEQEIEK